MLVTARAVTTAPVPGFCDGCTDGSSASTQVRKEVNHATNFFLNSAVLDRRNLTVGIGGLTFDQVLIRAKAECSSMQATWSPSPFRAGCAAFEQSATSGCFVKACGQQARAAPRCPACCYQLGLDVFMMVSGCWRCKGRCLVPAMGLVAQGLAEYH